MTFATLARDARLRTRSVRASDAESGFMMIYVLMISTVVTLLVGTTLMVSANSILPAVRSAYNQAADAAAQSGVQAFLSLADTSCSGATATIASCTTMPASGSGTIYTGSNYTSSYAWTAVKGTNYFRVTSSGTVVKGGITATRKLIADIAGGASPNLLDYSYVTQYETQAPDVAQQLFPARTIALNPAAMTSAGIPATGTSVSWSGAPAGAAAGTVNLCNAVYYNTAASPTTGRVNTPAPGAPTPYVDWSESGSVGASSYTGYQPCQVSFGHSTQLLAPTSSALGVGGIRSNDALLISNSYPGGTGPVFNQPVTTGYKYDAALDGACGTTGQNYRSFDLRCAGYAVDVGGTPAPGSYLPQYNGTLPVWSTGAPTIPAGACWYQGPTRIKLNSDGSATITSLQTVATISPSALACYGGTAPNASTGMIAVNVPNIAAASGGVLRVRNNGSAPVTPPSLHTSIGWAAVNTRAAISSTNSVFYASIPASGPTAAATTYVDTAPDLPYTPAPPDNPSTKPDASWTPQWTSDSTLSTGCASLTNGADLKFYRCFAGAGGTYDASAYVNLKAAVKAALLASPGNYISAANLVTLLNSTLSQANTSDAANAAPSNYTAASRRWQVSVVQNATPAGGCTPASATTGPVVTTIPAPIPPSVDPLFGNTDGQRSVSTQNVTTCFTATVSLQVGTCSILLVPITNLCLGSKVWGNGTALAGSGLSIPQFTMTETVKGATATTTTTLAASQFPIATDVTPYAMPSTSASGPGDLYVEGTATASMALIAANDVVVTNSLAPNSATYGLEIIAQNNLRAYHPVTCTSVDAAAIAATTVGFCPNDITGLYSGVLATAARPDQQYTNLSPSVANLTIHGVIFALGIPQSSVSCPQPPQGGGVCGGEFTVDNYSRGDSVGTSPLGTLTDRRHPGDGASRAGRAGMGDPRCCRTDQPTLFRLPVRRAVPEPQERGGRARPEPADVLDDLVAVARRQRLDGNGFMNTPWPVLVLIGLLGLMIGSFLNVVIYRVPRRESLMFPASRCTSCETPIKPQHNVPVLSWLALRGQCATCRVAISWRYPLVEAATAALFVAITLRFGLSLQLPAYLYLGAVGITLLMIGVDLRQLPNSIVLPSYVVGRAAAHARRRARRRLVPCPARPGRDVGAVGDLLRARHCLPAQRELQ